MRPRRATAILIAVLLGLAGALVPAASASASVQGTIVDQANVPVVGIAAEIHEQISNAVVGSLTTDASGQFTYLPVLADGDYGLFVLDGAADTPGDTYGYNTIQFTVSGGNATVPTLVLSRYVNISGVIDNWSALGMGDVYVEVYRYYPVGDYWTGTSFDVTSTDGTFTIPLTVTTGTYTLWFSPDDYASPYVESFLGGEFYDPAVATTFHLDDGVGTSTIVMHMRDAAFVYGTVTSDGTTPIPGILVGADEQTTYPTPSHYTEATTDADGDYRLSVRPNATYVVYAYDSPLYLGMTYDGYDACGCQFTPVVSTIATPKTGVDFDLVLASTALYLEGFVLDDQLSLGNPLYGVYVHLYKPVPGGWTETDVSYSDGSGYFELLLPAFGSYRVRFELAGVWLPVIDGVSFEGSGGPPDLISGCYVDTGALDATSVSGNSAFVIFAGLDLAGGCGPEPAPSSGGTGGHSTPGHGRTSFGGGGNLVAATPTPTPSATPTSGPSPSSSPSDSPSASPTPDPVPAGDAGFPLWIILIIVLVLGIIVTIIVIVRRR
jgi:hypothetical protein